MFRVNWTFLSPAEEGINKKSINADYSDLKKLRQILKLLILKLMIESELLGIPISLVKVILKIVKRNIISSVLKTNPLTHIIKDLNGERLIGSFYEK